MTDLAGGLWGEVGFGAGFAAVVGFVAFAGFAAGLMASLAGVAALASACLAVALSAVSLLAVVGFRDTFVGALTLGAVVDVAVERREARFGVGFGFGSVTAAPPRDAADQ